MKKHLALLLSVLFVSQLIHAQDTASARPQPSFNPQPFSHPQLDSVIKLIPAGEGSHIYYLYTIGGKLVSPDDVTLRLLSYQPSANEYSQAKNNLIWGWVSFGGFAASTIAATLEYAANNKHVGETAGFVNGQPAFIYQHHSLTGAYIFTGAAVGLLTTSIITLVSASHHAKQALKVYNHQYE
jgi:hypothetical protein